MSSTWYKAVCVDHKVFCDVIVNDPIRTHHLLSDEADAIKMFLINHYGCALHLAWRDDQLDLLWVGYTDALKDPKRPRTPAAKP